MYVIKALTNIKYKVNITNQRNNQNVCTNNNANEKNEDNPFVSMFPIKNDKDFQTLERLLMDDQNRAKLVSFCLLSYLLIPLFNPIYVFNDDLYKC